MAGHASVYQTTLLEAATSSSGIDLGESFQNIYLDIPATSGAVSANVRTFINVSYDGSTYRRLAEAVRNSATVDVNDFAIESGTSLRVLPIPCQGVRYVKVEVGAIASAPVTYRFICGR